MNKSQRKQAAKQIAELERIIQNPNSSQEAIDDANNKILYLTERIDSFEDMIIIDELVRKILQGE